MVKRLQVDFSQQKVITVGGTNGKGTTCALIEQICLAAGFSVGVYSSPHLLSYCERIRINGKNIDDAALCAIFHQINQARFAADETIPLTYFEYATLAALSAFSQQQVDIVILEVGLGGRLDATNVIDSDIAVITSIGLDHQDWLGDTKEKIAYEKAGIFRPNRTAIVGEPNAQQSMLEYAEKIATPLKLVGKDFVYSPESEQVRVDQQSFSVAKANIPKQNVATALATVNRLSSLLAHEQPFLLPIAAIQSTIDSTTVMGRHHELRARNVDQSECPIILDVAHNEDSAKQLSALLRTYSFRTCHMVVGMLKDKNIEVSLSAFSTMNIHWYCATLPTNRGENAERLCRAVQGNEHSKQSGIPTVSSFPDVDSAYKTALKNAQVDDLILVMGSFLTVAAVLALHAKA
jgi:dihydrofolate synthase/folylpolyglutamate synthase